MRDVEPRERREHLNLSAIAEEIASGPVGIDIETTGLDPHTSQIRLLQLATGSNLYVLDLFKVGRPEPIIEALRRHEHVQIGHNLKFEQKFFLHHWGLELPRPFDTYRASALIYNGMLSGHTLWDLYRRELDTEPPTADLSASDWSGRLTPEQLDYARDDVRHLHKLYTLLRAKLVRDGLVRVATIEFQAILPEASIELNGFPINRQMWTELAAKNAAKEAELRAALLKELPLPKGATLSFPFGPDPWNLASPAQLLQVLTSMGVYVPDTAENTLAMAADQYPILRRIIDWRGYAQAVKSFGVDYLSNVNPVTRRIHTSFYPFTGAGRYASSKPNLQQLPRDKAFRSCFRPEEGRKFVIYDFSQIEIRLAAEIANDATLIDAYSKGVDAHTLTARIVSGSETPTKADRQAAKPINFGLIYGMGAKKLPLYAKANYGVNMTEQEAVRFHHAFFSNYSGIRAWHERVFSEENRQKGETRTLSGRIRYLPSEAFNEYANLPVQGTGADGLKRSLRCVYERFRKYGGKARLVHMVHDEIVTENDNDIDLEAVSKDVEAGMVEGMGEFLKRIPVVAEGGIASSWAEK